MLLLRFLGPFEAPAGETSVFCWRLERPQGAWAAAEEGSQELRYEVSAAHGSWDPAGVRKGRVLLGRAPGSVATVEAAFAPRALGRLACPRLVLHGVHSQVRFGGAVYTMPFTATVNGHSQNPLYCVLCPGAVRSHPGCGNYPSRAQPAAGQLYRRTTVV